MCIRDRFNDDGNMCFKYSLPSKGSEVLLVPYAYSYSEHSNLGDEKVLIELKNSKYDFDKHCLLYTSRILNIYQIMLLSN